ncbi:(2Fe-2S)-binding protein [Jatrophihabitans sp.]|uniref:(2Fe-2S)-binding protein n=1 Tax=Jatrophihabitans sp. TaxID=1932789 RepID=UPI0030C74817|nr:hypothetical protein [Jatrophihabitans sp.]
MPHSIDARAADALARVSAIGPYFAVQLGADDGPWRQFGELLDPAVLRENVDGVRRVLSERTRIPVADLDLRACASTHFLGLASRLLAPALGAAALTGHVPLIEVDGLRWQRVGGGPVPIAVVAAREGERNGPVSPPIGQLAAAFAATFALSPHVLWGNVASALNGAATMLLRSAEPLLVDPVAIVRTSLAQQPLLGRASYESGSFRRNNCCLFYKIPGGGMCGDCVLISGEEL